MRHRSAALQAVAVAVPASARRALVRAIRRPRWGNLGRERPFSERYGYERGQPVDRVYIERFLGDNAEGIRGAVLEVGSPRYTRQFGGSAVTASDVLDLDRSNRQATLYGDACVPGTIPANRFDCIIMTQTLHFLPDLAGALHGVWAGLRPNGVALVTVLTASRRHLPHDGPQDLWRFTPDGLACLLRSALPDAEIRSTGFGNLTTCLASLLGLAKEDLRPEAFARDDPDFPLIAAASARKAAGPA